jgi:hypothetical protein
MKHWEQTFAIYVYNYCNICNFPIYFYNIYLKHLQHTSETLETYAFSAISPCCLDEWSLSLWSLTTAKRSVAAHGARWCASGVASTAQGHEHPRRAGGQGRAPTASAAWTRAGRASRYKHDSYIVGPTRGSVKRACWQGC